MSVGWVALQANAVPTRPIRVKMGGVVYANVDLVVDDSVQALGFGITVVQIVDETTSRVRNGLNGELAEPITGIVAVPQGVSRAGHARQGDQGEGCGAEHLACL